MSATDQIHSLRNTATLRLRRLGVITATVAITVASATVAVAPAAVAAAPPKPKPVGAMRSAPPPKPAPDLLRGDLSTVGKVPGIPGTPVGTGGPTTSSPQPFDPSRSTVVDAATTPTKKLYNNPDGSQTAAVSTKPTRYRDEATNAWKDIDLTLVAQTDGTLGPKAAPKASARLSPEGDATVATVETSAGTIGVRLPAATAAPAAAKGRTATYRGAMGRADLSIALNADGLEDTVTLADATAGPTHRIEFALPAGVSARNAQSGIEFVDAGGTVVATYGSGIAHDASPLGTPKAATPVTVALASGTTTSTTTPQATLPALPGARALVDRAKPSGGVARVDVGVDPAWLGDPARVFPVTVDPFLTKVTSTAPGSGMDTWVWGYQPTTPYGAMTNLDVGAVWGIPARSLLWFNPGVTPAPNMKVNYSYLQAYNTVSMNCTPSIVNLQGVGAAWNATTATWNNQPPLDGAGVVSSPKFSYGATGCAANWAYFDTTSLAQRWLTGSPNFGLELFAANETDLYQAKAFDSTESGISPLLIINYKNGPDAAVYVSPADGAVLSSPTPNLVVGPGYSPDQNPVTFDYLVTTSPDAFTGNRVVDSGWTPQTTWSVPQGALTDGMTYWWQVLTFDGTVTTSQAQPFRSFRVDLGLGTKGPLPHDDLGPARVNLANGNLVVGSASPRPSGLSYTYNSQASAGGLTGAYYPETSGLTPPPFNTLPANPALVRRDANVDGLWVAAGPGPLASTNFRVRWKGTITLPEGTWGSTNPAAWTFGAYAQDGIVVTINGARVVDRWNNETWSSPTPTGFFGSPQQLLAKHSYSIQVDYYTHSTFGFVSLLATGPDAKTGSVLPSWLHPDNDALPSGWTMAAANAGYVSARISDAAVTLLDASGATHLYTANGSGGYTPPADGDATLAADAAGNLTLAADDGLTYVFDPGGQLVGATAATDDRYPSSPGYVWYPEVGNRQAGDATKPIDASKPMRLMAITDPAAGRQHTLRYAGATSATAFDPVAPCPTPPAGFDLAAAPPYSLCEVDYSDNTSTKLWYNAGGQLARIEDPGDPAATSAANLPAMTDFAYNAAGVMSAIRTPLINDAIAADKNANPKVTGVPPDPNDDRTRTRIDYGTGQSGACPVPVVNPGQVCKVTLPTPNAGALLEAPRTAHSYDYSVANQATVHTDYPSGQAASFEPAGFSRRTTFPPRAADGTLTVTDTNANGTAATAVIDAGNHPLSATDAAGRETTKVYADDAMRSHPIGTPSDTYGAAPVACFGPDRRAVSPPCATPPAHTATTYDTAADGTVTQGLAAAYWSNLGLSGLPARHATVAPAAGSLVAADPPAEGLTTGAWSARFSGEVVLGSSGTYTFTLALAGSARLYVDDKLVVDGWGPHGATVSGGFVQPPNPPSPQPPTPIRRRIRIDYAVPAGAPAQLGLRWAPPDGGDQPIAASSLAPRYTSVTKTVTDDNNGVPTRVATTNVESQTGLVKAVTIDPGGLNLTTSTTYEDVGDGKFRRQIARTLPAGDVATPSTGTVYGYYAGVTHPQGQTVPAEKGIVVPGCGDFSGVNQGGALKTTTAAQPDPATPAVVTTSVHDAAGRVVASHHNADPWTCTTYDPRGRVTSVSIPGLGDPRFGATAAAGRVVTNSYAVGANPLVRSTSDGLGTLTTTVDLLGRVVATLDAFGDPNAAANSPTDHKTVVSYDQAGRQVTSDGPGGRLDNDYAGTRVTRQHVGNPGDLAAGPVVAVPSYDNTSGELTAVSYCAAAQTTGACATGVPNGGNATTLTVGRDANGRSNHLGWSGPAGGIVDDVVLRSQGGAVVDETIDGTDAKTSGPNFTYDAAGRLTAANVPGHALTYAFAPTGGCGVATSAGSDTNRTATTDNGGLATTYCYDRADRITSSSDTTNVGTPVYDPHGNATRMGTQFLGYDSSGRHVRTDTSTGPSLSVTYTRDPANRLLSRAENGVTTARYGFAGAGDAPAFAMDTNNAVTQRFVALAGGAMVTRQASGDVWSYPNVHGDVVATATGTNTPTPGTKIGPTLSYDPFGQALGDQPNNAPSNVDFGWLGQSQRSTEHAGTSTVMEMGARPYVPAAGRFVTVDPVPGGSANDYDYVGGDPVNGRDLDGTRQTTPDPHTYDVCVNGNIHEIPRDQWDATIYSSTCESYRQANFNKSIGNPYDYSAPVLPIPPPPSDGGIINAVGNGLKTVVGGGASSLQSRANSVIASEYVQVPARAAGACFLGVKAAEAVTAPIQPAIDESVIPAIVIPIVGCVGGIGFSQNNLPVPRP